MSNSNHGGTDVEKLRSSTVDYIAYDKLAQVNSMKL